MPIVGWEKIAYQRGVYQKSLDYLRSDSSYWQVKEYLDTHDFEEGILGTVHWQPYKVL